MASELWVKLGNNRATQVSTDGCSNVDKFLEACQKKLSKQLGSYDIDQLSLSTTENGTPLEPDAHLPPENTARTPLAIRITPPPNQPGAFPSLKRSGSDDDADFDEDRHIKKPPIPNDILSNRLKVLADAQLVNGFIQSEHNGIFPYHESEIGKLYVRKCYEEVFDLLMCSIGKKLRSFGISGTPGIGKSLFFVYLLYRLLIDSSTKSLPLKPSRVLYHFGTDYYCYDLQNRIITRQSRMGAGDIVMHSDTFYVVDGSTSDYLHNSTTALFISSPRSEYYKKFVKQLKAICWFFPVWTLDELESCRVNCFSDLSPKIVRERFRLSGGVARSVFAADNSSIPAELELALTDVDAVQGVRRIGYPTGKYTNSHTLFHMIVSDDGNYRYRYMDIASKHVGEQLWIRYHAEMITNLRDMYGGSPNEISRHLFEIYGHLRFSSGGFEIKCRCLEDNVETVLSLDKLDGKRYTFGKESIPAATDLTGKYYEPTDDDTFPAIDSLTAQGMFQFTVAVEHPIRGVQVLQKLCKLYSEPRLFFVVPNSRFEAFKKQKFQAKKGTKKTDEINGLKQYVLCLEVK